MVASDRHHRQIEVIGTREERDESLPEAVRELEGEKLTYLSRVSWG